MTPRKQAPAQPVANLAQAKRQQAALKQAEAAAKTRHPSGKKVAPAAKAPAKSAAAKKVAEPAEKVTYAATSRTGVTRTQQSATPLIVAVEAVIPGKGGQRPAVIAFYASKEKAQAAVDQINSGSVDGWSDAKLVAVTAVAKAVSA